MTGRTPLVRLGIGIVAFGMLLGGSADRAGAQVTDQPGSVSLTGTPSCFAEQARVFLYWTPSADAERFTLYRDGSVVETFAPILWYGGDYTDQLLAGGQTYTYRVLATNQGQAGTWSNPVRVTALNCAPLSVAVTPQQARFPQTGGQRTALLTAEPGDTALTPQPSHWIIDFDDDRAVGSAISTEYQAEFGVTFAPLSSNQQEHPVIAGPGLPVGNACPGGASEASSPPNFLAPHSETHQNFGGTGFGGFTATFSPPVTRPELTVLSVGGSTVTITYTRSDGSTSTQTVGPNRGAEDGACKKNLTQYPGDESIASLTLRSDAPVGGADGIGIDDLVFTRSVAPGQPSLSWYVTDESIGHLQPQADNTAVFTAYPGLAPGTYANLVVAEVTLGTRRGSDAADIIIEPPTCSLAVDLAASPSSVEAGAAITVDWSATSCQSTPNDWIAMYPVTEPETDVHDFGLWQWVDDGQVGGRTSGTRTFVAPVEAGTYVFRYLLGAPPQPDWYTSIAVSNPVTVTAPAPVLGPATIDPARADLTLTEQADGTYLGTRTVAFTGQCWDAATPPAEVAAATKTWSATVGSVTGSGLWTAPLAETTGSVTVTCTYEQAVRTATAPVAVTLIPVIDPPPPGVSSRQIFGDIFAGGSVGNLTVDERSLVVAGGDVDPLIGGASQSLDRYVPTERLRWAAVASELDGEITRLVREEAELLSVSQIEGSFNLNPPVGTSPLGGATRTNVTRPEGTVWRVAGDLTIGPTVFTGRGTIIVDGTVRLEGPGAIAYRGTSDALGLVVRNVTGTTADTALIIDGPSRFVGAFYVAKGSLVIGPAAGGGRVTGTGFLASARVRLDATELTLTYDERLSRLQPPGFSKRALPELSDAIP